MEVQSVIIGAGLVSAAIGGTSIASYGVFRISDKLRNQKVQERSGVESSFLGTALRHGVSFLFRPAQMALSFSNVGTYAEKIEQAVMYRGKQTTPEALITLLITASLVVFVFGFAVSGSPLAGVALASCVWLLVGLWANHACDERREQLRDAIPEALQSMKACFQVGYTLSQTVSEVRKNTTGPLEDLFREVEGVLETGGSTEDALKVLKKKASEPELVFLATALEIQHKTGSSMQQVLEITRQSVADEIELKRTLKTQTAQAKLSAQIVTIMPFALIGVFSLLSPGFLDPFFESALGVVMLLCALGMQVLGVFLVRRLLRVEVI